MGMEVDGEYTTAEFCVSDESLIEDNCIEQVQKLTNHPAFTNPIKMMPDAHYGPGAPIGFSMELGAKIVPNIVGLDVGCGMAAANIGSKLPLENNDRETKIRNAVPMGSNTHDYDSAPHLINEFPFERANEVFKDFNQQYRSKFGEEVTPIEFEFSGYDGEYFKSLCKRVLRGQRQNMGYVIKSAGTLGGGNHFIEISKSDIAGDYWIVIHTGSRYLGKSVSEYWQNKATETREMEAIRNALTDTYTEYIKFDPQTVSDHDLFEWVTGGKGESYIKKHEIRNDFTEDDIDTVFKELTAVTSIADTRESDLDYLTENESHGYLIDMLFAQQYAQWNRELIIDAILDALDVEATDRLQSIHNYIDFDDMIVRKGATPARDGERLIIPFNMADGAVIAQGKGNMEYNQTAPHGAGRRMSRRKAKDSIDIDEFETSMNGIYSESVTEETIDESPMAYKSVDGIQESMKGTVEILETLTPVHSIKALD